MCSQHSPMNPDPCAGTLWGAFQRGWGHKGEAHGPQRAPHPSHRVRTVNRWPSPDQEPSPNRSLLALDLARLVSRRKSCCYKPPGCGTITLTAPTDSTPWPRNLHERRQKHAQLPSNSSSAHAPDPTRKARRRRGLAARGGTAFRDPEARLDG